jgi:antitoxin (DNA-binding transcriptional repressor) of toxin-antitoxin stability system
MQLSIRELKANLAHAIELVQMGELVEITSRRKVVAELVKPGKTSDNSELADVEAIRRLIASGQVQAPTKPFKLGRAIKLSRPTKGQSVSDLVSEMRGTR